ncbi:MAG TPA: glycoside hydrolase family 97 catalytic domain-containing protein [Flavisolibacter sp.]|nr:glycoside hydrolase family 97 catalytic domain-containing protein [Flavisolibacter sp.]
MFKRFFATALLLVYYTSGFAQAPFVISSPDKTIVLTAWVNGGGEARYKISYRQKTVLKESRLGLRLEDEDFSIRLKQLSPSVVEAVKDRYELFTGKRRIANYSANRRIMRLQNGSGKKLDVIFQISNDGLAFRYALPGDVAVGKRISAELTSFHFDTSARAFLQPMQVAKTGWEKTNPAYEEHYKQGIPVTDSSPTKAGWVYPALFQCQNTWVLITEASVDSNHCATRLQNVSPDGEYAVGFPDPREVINDGGLLSKTTRGGALPWRIITIGGLKTIVESTLGTDVAKPAIDADFSFVKPGKASWSWINSKDDSLVYSEQIRYVDFAAKMGWEYCLVDADWDRKIGYEKIQELSAYAAAKGVGLLLWYNSAGDWNTVKYTPKSKLLFHEDRMKEFGRLKEMGIKGVKIDFFGGDGQSVIAYYHAILQDAAQVGLMVNFHGATLPRGWHRTYPHLVTVEAVKGFEFITFNQSDADAEATHCAMLPFARNAFDPMDFTPMNLYKIQTRVKRRTTSAFELATSVLFLSGIQHFAESPAGMTHVPDYIQQFLKELPTRWDDVKFVDGFPGKYVVIARKAGDKWYIAGINGENAGRTIKVDLKPFQIKNGLLIKDGSEPLTFETEQVNQTTNKSITLKPAGGFVLVLE